MNDEIMQHILNALDVDLESTDSDRKNGILSKEEAADHQRVYFEAVQFLRSFEGL